MTRAPGYRSAVLAASLVAVACSSGKKGDPAELDQALGNLVACQQEQKRAKTAVEMCEKQLEEARKAQPVTDDQGFTVRIEGDVLTVYGKPRAHGNGGADLRPDDARKVSDAVINQVRLSKNGLQQCYVAALKKNESIQQRTISLHVVVTVQPSGKVAGTSFSPSISPDFNACVARITSKWKLPPFTAGGNVPFDATVTLQPAE